MSGTAEQGEPVPAGRDHLAALAAPLQALGAEVERLDRWGRHLAVVLGAGGRLLAAGNGGSAAQAQHLTSELVGRYRDDRPAFSALALHAESSAVTAIANDYGYDESFARQVRAHGRPGDVLVTLSTSGRSGNVLAAAEAARERGLLTWALTGPAPNPLQAASDDALCVTGATATVQEIHQIAVHLLCAAFEQALAVTPATGDGTHADRGRAVHNRRVSGGAARPVVVVGDALLDCDLEGSVERLCPDAPVPVVDRPVRQARPGGAGLAAALAAAGRPVAIVTALGDDDAGRELAGLLAGQGVEVIDLTTAGETPQKVRVTSGGRSLIRLDHGGPPGPIGLLTDHARQALGRAAAILVSDYGRGLTAHRDLRQALTGVRVPLVWDPHPRGAPPVPGARLVTPNRAEAAQFAADADGARPAGGRPDDGRPDDAGAGLAAVAAQARALAQRWRAAGVAVTLGADGAVLVAG
ncbi:MAG: D-beta-D-heptose 7-phosphate kinase / D-beta-D-heptose 1-phosphate adenosyltransferase, partial [Actinomycetota bacterium]|nr:D-beta-D-heptose 7-phosphate kinase / D-beta-D-heptose 1-phosphate adenosyltransferase [Actinomycetota bacterium]